MNSWDEKGMGKMKKIKIYYKKVQILYDKCDY